MNWTLKTGGEMKSRQGTDWDLVFEKSYWLEFNLW